MGLFRKKRRKSLVDLIPPDERLRDPFDAVPVAADGVVADSPGNGETLVVHREIAPKPGLSAWVKRTFRFRKVAHLRLDPCGTFFWRQMDGRRTLADIARAMGKQFGWSAEQCRDALVVFVRDLMLRHFIYLQIPRGGKKQVSV